MTSAALTASDLTAMLRRHYLPENRPAAGVFAAEIGSPDGVRRADALWMPLTRSGGTGLVGHEIKVSRADVLVELQDPTKAEPWLQFCERWWLVVADPALVEGLEIPDAWGIMSPPSGRRTRSMTMIRKAPTLHPRNAAPGLQRLLSWSFYRQSAAIDAAQRDRDFYKRQHEAAQARLAEQPVAHDSPAAARVRAIVAKVEKGARDRQIWASADDDTVVEAIIDATLVRDATRTAAKRLHQLSRELEDPFAYAKRHVDQVRALFDEPSTAGATS